MHVGVHTAAGRHIRAVKVSSGEAVDGESADDREGKQPKKKFSRIKLFGVTALAFITQHHNRCQHL